MGLEDRESPHHPYPQEWGSSPQRAPSKYCGLSEQMNQVSSLEVYSVLLVMTFVNLCEELRVHYK